MCTYRRGEGETLGQVTEGGRNSRLSSASDPRTTCILSISKIPVYNANRFKRTRPLSSVRAADLKPFWPFIPAKIMQSPAVFPCLEKFLASFPFSSNKTRGGQVPANRSATFEPPEPCPMPTLPTLPPNMPPSSIAPGQPLAPPGPSSGHSWSQRQTNFPGS